MIKSIHIENYKCFKDFTMEDIGPFTVLVGPNDSGKTAFLEAVRLATFGWSQPLGAGHIRRDLGIEAGSEAHWMHRTDLKVIISAFGEDSFRKDSRAVVLEVRWRSLDTVDAVAWEREKPNIHPPSHDGLFAELSKHLGMSAYYRFDPRALREVTPLVGEMSRDGKGLSTLLDDIFRGKDSQCWPALNAQFRERFPHYANLWVGKAKLPDGSFGPMVRFESAHGYECGPDGVSDGVLLSLAFMALRYRQDSPGILLIEEPENGVHPGSLKEIVKTLRELSEKGTQVILTTHSPYLVDLVQPEEVRVFWKAEEGAVHAARLSDYPDVDEVSKHFMTGEIWTSLEDGKIVKTVLEARGKK